jgi:hypothetical protein
MVCAGSKLPLMKGVLAPFGRASLGFRRSMLHDMSVFASHTVHISRIRIAQLIQFFCDGTRAHGPRAVQPRSNRAFRRQGVTAKDGRSRRPAAKRAVLFFGVHGIFHPLLEPRALVWCSRTQYDAGSCHLMHATTAQLFLRCPCNGSPLAYMTSLCGACNQNSGQSPAAVEAINSDAERARWDERHLLPGGQARGSRQMGSLGTGGTCSARDLVAGGGAGR